MSAWIPFNKQMPKKGQTIWALEVHKELTWPNGRRIHALTVDQSRNGFFYGIDYDGMGEGLQFYLFESDPNLYQHCVIVHAWLPIEAIPIGISGETTEHHQC